MWLKVTRPKKLFFICLSKALHLIEEYVGEDNVITFGLAITALHNVLFAQYALLPNEQAETYLKIYVLYLIQHMYLSQLVRLEGKLDFQGNRDFQTLNLGFPGNFD